jgi:hypothetical protein
MLTFDRVFCKKLQSDDAGFLVFTEEDVNCCVDITSTKDFKYMTVNSNTRTSSEEGFFYTFSDSKCTSQHLSSALLHRSFLFFAYTAAGFCDGV